MFHTRWRYSCPRSFRSSRLRSKILLVGRDIALYLQKMVVFGLLVGLKRRRTQDFFKLNTNLELLMRIYKRIKVKMAKLRKVTLT
jgi:hypothetical protein